MYFEKGNFLINAFFNTNLIFVNHPYSMHKKFIAFREMTKSNIHYFAILDLMTVIERQLYLKTDSSHARCITAARKICDESTKSYITYDKLTAISMSTTRSNKSMQGFESRRFLLVAPEVRTEGKRSNKYSRYLGIKNTSKPRVRGRIW